MPSLLLSNILWYMFQCFLFYSNNVQPCPAVLCTFSPFPFYSECSPFFSCAMFLSVLLCWAGQDSHPPLREASGTPEACYHYCFLQSVELINRQDCVCLCVCICMCIYVCVCMKALDPKTSLHVRLLWLLQFIANTDAPATFLSYKHIHTTIHAPNTLRDMYCVWHDCNNCAVNSVLLILILPDKSTTGHILSKFRHKDYWTSFAPYISIYNPISSKEMQNICSSWLSCPFMLLWNDCNRGLAVRNPWGIAHHCYSVHEAETRPQTNRWSITDVCTVCVRQEKQRDTQRELFIINDWCF